MKYIEYLKITFELFFSAIIFILIPLIAFVLITSRSNALFGIQSFTVLSGSMSPMIKTGNIVFTFKNSEVKVGDIITFKRESTNVTHRVVNVVDKKGKPVSNSLLSPITRGGDVFYQTKGDANNSVDTNLVARKDLIGKAFFQVPMLGRLSAFLKTPIGYFGLILLPTIVFIGFELWNIKKEIEKSIEERFRRQMGVI